MVAVPATAGAQTLFGSGSSAEQPILQVLFRAYNRLHPSIRFNYLADGGNAGVQDVQAGRRLFAVNTRPPLPSDAGTTYFKLFLDGLCVAVNPSNSISGLTITQTKNIFTGVATNWSQIAGSNLTTTIDPVGRNSSAGSYTFFQQAVLGGQTQSSNVHPVTSDGLVATSVSKDQSGDRLRRPGARRQGQRRQDRDPERRGVQRRRTSRTRPIRCSATSGGSCRRTSASRTVEKFFDWVRTSKQAGQIIHRAGAVPAFNKK